MTLITWENKVRIITVPGDRINQWRQEDANETKDAINDIETRTVDLESGEGLIETIDVAAEWTSLLIFDVTANNFPVNSIWYAATPDTITLDAADGSNPRFDLLTAIAPVSPATVGTVGKITGVPAASPARPDYDPSLVYPIKFVLVNTSATTPSDTSTELVYDEGAGEPTEWVATESTSGARITIDSTNDAFSGTKSIEFTESTGSDILTLTNATTILTTFIGLVTFYVKLKEDYGNKGFTIRWYNSTTEMSKAYYFRNGKNGYDSSDLTWQKITIDGSKFRFIEGSVDNFTLQIADSTPLDGAYFDLFKIHEGSGSDNPNNWVEEAPIDGTPYARQDAQWSSVSLVGEANTASNQGGGVGIFKQKAALDLEFYGLAPGSSKITTTLDGGTGDIDIDVVEANIALANINTSSLTYPVADGTSGQAIVTDGAGTLSMATVLTGTVESVHLDCRKSSAGTIVKGTPCYFVSWNASGYIEVEAADANDGAKMPAVGLTTVDTTNSATVRLAVSGIVEGLVTNAFSDGDELWVSDDPSTDRGLTSTKPETVDDKIQKVALVMRSHASQGVLLVVGAGRENDVPNIASNNFWLGSAPGAAVATDFDVEVSLNSDVTTNTAKAANVPTALSVGTVTSTTVAITSDGSVDDVTFPAFAGGSTNAGLVTGSNSADNTNFLRADNSWATPAGAGDVVKVGTPVNNELGVWTGDGTIEGDTTLEWDGTNLDITGNIVISGTVDGIDIATDVAANTSKVTNATHTGEVTGATTLTIDKTAISGKSAVAMATDDRILIGDTSDSDNLKKAYIIEVLQMALGDETNDIATGTGKLTFDMPNYATTLLGVAVYVKTAPTGSTAIFDLNEGGTSVLSVKVSIDIGETSSETAATAPVISDTALAANAIMTWDIDQIGSTVAGVAPKAIIYYTKS